MKPVHKNLNKKNQPNAAIKIEKMCQENEIERRVTSKNCGKARKQKPVSDSNPEQNIGQCAPENEKIPCIFCDGYAKHIENTGFSAKNAFTGPTWNALAPNRTNIFMNIANKRFF